MVNEIQVLNINQISKSLNESETIIKNNETLVGMGLWNIGNEFKYIRDNKTYKEKSYSSFEEYTEKELDYSRRHAYRFIEISEQYSVTSMSQIGHLGMTKLTALSKLEETEREEFIENNKVDEMTTREIKESVQAYKRNSNNIVDEVYDDNTYDIPIDKLKPFPDHEKYFWDMKGKNYVNFLASIEENGVINPIIITRDNMIISGHQRVRACKDLGIDIIPARYLYSENKQNRKLDDLLLSTFFSCNMHTRSCVFYLALAWQDLYFGSKDKVDYYIKKFIDEDDSESDEYIVELKERIKRIKK